MSGSSGFFTNTAPATSKERCPSASWAWSTRMATRPHSVMSGAAQMPEGLVMEQAVGREHRAGVDVGLAGEVGELAARLLDENLHGRDVPGLEIGLGVDLRLALRHHAVAEVVAEATLPRGRVHEALEPRPESGGAQDVQARVDQERVLHHGARRHVDALAVGPGALALPRPEHPARRRILGGVRAPRGRDLAAAW